MNGNERRALTVVLNETSNNQLLLNDTLTERADNYELLLTKMMTDRTLSEIICAIQKKNSLGYVSATFMVSTNNYSIDELIGTLNELGFVVMLSDMNSYCMISIDWCEFTIPRDIQNSLEREYFVTIHEPSNYHTNMLKTLRAKNPIYGTLTNILSVQNDNEFYNEIFTSDHDTNPEEDYDI